MPLMDRIKVIPYHTFSYERKAAMIQRLQLLRSNSIEEARIKNGGMTKSAYKNRKKKSKKVVTKSTAIKALDKLTPAQLKKILEKLA